MASRKKNKQKFANYRYRYRYRSDIGPLRSRYDIGPISERYKIDINTISGFSTVIFNCPETLVYSRNRTIFYLFEIYQNLPLPLCHLSIPSHSCLLCNPSFKYKLGLEKLTDKLILQFFRIEKRVD